MRVTGGSLKGRRVFSPGSLQVRPTLDSVREAVFNILGQDLSGVAVLDLFAGTGIFGIEALSRGAQRAVFIDKSSDSLALIARNLEACGLTPRARLFRKDLAKGLPSDLKTLEGTFDLVFMDPPYGKGFIPLVLEALSKDGILAPGALVIAESSRREEAVKSRADLKAVESRNYGDTALTFYRQEVGDE